MSTTERTEQTTWACHAQRDHTLRTYWLLRRIEVTRRQTTSTYVDLEPAR
jgi:hypothetical protein